MFWLLLLTSGLLSLIHFLGIEAILVKALEIPLPYYISVLLGIVAIRVILSLVQYFLIAREYFRKLKKLFVGGPKGPKTQQPPTSGSGSNQKRGYSTLARVKTAKIARNQFISPYQSELKKLGMTRQLVKNNFFRTISKLGSLVSLVGKGSSKGAPSLLALFKEVGFRVIGACFPSKVKFRNRLAQLNRFRDFLRKMERNHGPTFVVKFLKLNQLAIQKCIAGTPVKSLTGLDPTFYTYSRLSPAGLPVIIPTRDSGLVLRRASPVIRWYLTLFAVYRVIKVPGVIKLGTITDPMTVSQASVDKVASELTMLVPQQILNLETLAGSRGFGHKVGVPMNPPLPLLESASATFSVAWMGYIADILTLKAQGQFNNLVEFCKITGQLHFMKMMLLLERNLSKSMGLIPWTSGLGLELVTQSPVGKLSLKEEAAGKVRVFAMVTVWDQAILTSLHKMLFDFLKTLNNDGTFDQEASVRRCMDKSMRSGKSFGYDLSAATDRLPVSQQETILNKLLPGLGTIWRSLLTGRDYVLATKSKRYSLSNGKYRYAVGQPMGALSSWAMLAVHHHLLAQLAAYRYRVSQNPDTDTDPFHFWNYLGWYEGYEVLGDDIVFFEEGVAHQYLILMETIGVPINLGKSVVANNPTFEFAKVTGHYGVTVAAISWAMFMAQPTAMGRVGICYSLLRKRITSTGIIRYITTLSRESKYKLGRPNLFLIALATMFSKNGRLDFEALLHTIIDHSTGKPSIAKAILQEGSLTRLTSVIPKLFTVDDYTAHIELSKNLFLEQYANRTSIKESLVELVLTYVYGEPDETAWRKSLGAQWIKDPLNPQRDAARVAKHIAIAMISAAGPANLGAFLEPLEKEGAFNLRPKAYAKLSPVGCLIHCVYSSIYTDLYERLLKVWVVCTSTKPRLLKKLELATLMEMLAELDQYHRDCDVVSRAVQKLSKELIPSKNLIESPLKILETILKANSMVAFLKDAAADISSEDLTRFTRDGSRHVGYTEGDYQRTLSLRNPNVFNEIIGYIKPRFIGQSFSAPEFREFYPWNYLAGQTEYLYGLTAIDYLFEEETLYFRDSKD